MRVFVTAATAVLALCLTACGDKEETDTAEDTAVEETDTAEDTAGEEAE